MRSFIHSIFKSFLFIYFMQMSPLRFVTQCPLWLQTRNATQWRTTITSSPWTFLQSMQVCDVCVRGVFTWKFVVCVCFAQWRVRITSSPWTCLQSMHVCDVESCGECVWVMCVCVCVCVCMCVCVCVCVLRNGWPRSRRALRPVCSRCRCVMCL